MIRTDAEYKKAQKKLDHQQETLQRQREQLQDMDLSEEEVERALEPMIFSAMGSERRSRPTSRCAEATCPIFITCAA